jgi:hypothetical protein
MAYQLIEMVCGISKQVKAWSFQEKQKSRFKKRD